MPVKYHSPELRKLLADMEIMAVKKLCTDAEIESSYYHWHEAKSDREGSIVALCDCLAVLYKIHDEVVRRGNRSVGDIADNLNTALHFKMMACSTAFEFEDDVRRDDSPFQGMYRDCMKMIDAIKSRGIA